MFVRWMLGGAKDILLCCVLFTGTLVIPIAVEDLLCRMWLRTRSLFTNAAIKLSSPAKTVAHMICANFILLSPGCCV